MESDRIHELTAPYALDALDPADEQRYLEHLQVCERCRHELAALRETAATLALAAGGPAPPAGLRARILAGARATVRRRRPSRPRSLIVALVTTVLAGCASIGLGAWSLTLSHRLHATRSQLADVQQVAHLMTRSDTRRVALNGRPGQLLVAPDGEAALVTTLDRAPSGSLYEVWVTVNGRPIPAGAFRGGTDRPVLVLSEPVESGTVVMITIEHVAQPPKPTSSPVATAQVT